MELGLNLKLTTTVRANLTAYRRQAEDGSDEWEVGARLGVDWRPHPWLNFTAGYDGIGGGKTSSSFLARVSVPIGGSSIPKPAGKDWGLLPETKCPVSLISGGQSTKSAGPRSPDESHLRLWRIE